MIIIIQRVVYHFFDYSYPRTVMNVELLIKKEGRLRSVNDALHGMGIVQSDNTIRSAEDSNLWLLRTGLSATREIDPSEVVSKLEALDFVVSVKVL